MNIPQDIKDIHQILKAAGKQLFVVGGCVRDHLIGSNIEDYDMATDAMPYEIIALLEDKYNLDFQGKSFGVIRVFTKACPMGYEIATFRQDITVGRQPEVRLGVTIEEDVRRRDFTINALFFDLDKNEIVDFVGGVNDIENNIIRCVGVPEERFNEDRLRVLRGIRFALRFGFVIDDDTASAIYKCHILEGPDKDGAVVPIVRERINEEMSKAFKQISSPLMYFRMLEDFRMLEQILPGYTYPNFWIDSKLPEVLIASLYHPERPKDTAPEFKSMLMDKLKFSAELSEGIELLLNASFTMSLSGGYFAAHGCNITKLRKRLPNITDEDLALFLDWTILNETESLNAKALALSAFKLTVTGQDLLDEGMTPGPGVGQEINAREIVKFNKLMQGCIQVIRKENEAIRIS